MAFKNKFTGGEIGKWSLGAADDPVYQRGAARLENFTLLETGGVNRRKGWKYTTRILDDLEDGAVKLIPPARSERVNYLIYVSKSRYGCIDGAFICRWKGAGVNSFFCYTSGEWDELHSNCPRTGNVSARVYIQFYNGGDRFMVPYKYPLEKNVWMNLIPAERWSWYEFVSKSDDYIWGDPLEAEERDCLVEKAEILRGSSAELQVESVYRNPARTGAARRGGRSRSECGLSIPAQDTWSGASAE